MRHGRGVALLLTLVATLILAAAAMALVRGAFATAKASGDLALRHRLEIASLAAVEAGLRVIGASAGLDLDTDAPASNYFASRQPGEDVRGIPATLQSRSVYPAVARVITAGDLSIRYIVERLCTAPGAVTAARCTLPPPGAAANAGAPELDEPPRTPYYRVSVRVDAQAGATVFAQAMLAAGPAPRRLAWRIVTEP